MSQTNEHDPANPHSGTESEAAPAANPAIGEEAAETAALTEQVAVLAAEVERQRDERLRALAEVENVRRRAARDVADARNYAVSAFARDLLSVADNLARAIASAGPVQQGGDPVLGGLLTGIEMTEKELVSIFDRHGVRRIDALGQPFDPNLHEALFELPEKSVATGTVVQVIQEGYRLHDRTLRPARVGVSRGGPPRQLVSDAPRSDTAAPPPDVTAGDGAEAYDRQADGGPETPGGRIDETT